MVICGFYEICFITLCESALICVIFDLQKRTEIHLVVWKNHSKIVKLEEHKNCRQKQQQQLKAW